LTSEKGIAGDCLDWTHLVRSPQELFQILGLGAFVRAEDSVQRLSAAPSHAAVEDVVGEANALGMLPVDLLGQRKQLPRQRPVAIDGARKSVGDNGPALGAVERLEDLRASRGQHRARARRKRKRCTHDEMDLGRGQQARAVSGSGDTEWSLPESLDEAVDLALDVGRRVQL
jgi:hypothetical protein